jgi:hypothetical protein
MGKKRETVRKGTSRKSLNKASKQTKLNNIVLKKFGF